MYFSHEILNEQERLIVLDPRRRLFEEINVNNFYSITCDEASDILKVDQLSFTVRTCNDSYKTSEDFLGILPCDEGLTSDALLKYIQDILLRCSMDTEVGWHSFRWSIIHGSPCYTPKTNLG